MELRHRGSESPEQSPPAAANCAAARSFVFSAEQQDPNIPRVSPQFTFQKGNQAVQRTRTPSLSTPGDLPSPSLAKGALLAAIDGRDREHDVSLSPGDTITFHGAAVKPEIPTAGRQHCGTEDIVAVSEGRKPPCSSPVADKSPSGVSNMSPAARKAVRDEDNDSGCDYMSCASHSDNDFSARRSSLRMQGWALMALSSSPGSPLATKVDSPLPKVPASQASTAARSPRRRPASGPAATVGSPLRPATAPRLGGKPIQDPLSSLKAAQTQQTLAQSRGGQREGPKARTEDTLHANAGNGVPQLHLRAVEGKEGAQQAIGYQSPALTAVQGRPTQQLGATPSKRQSVSRSPVVGSTSPTRRVARPSPLAGSKEAGNTVGKSPRRRPAPWRRSSRVSPPRGSLNRSPVRGSATRGSATRGTAPARSRVLPLRRGSSPAKRLPQIHSTPLRSQAKEGAQADAEGLPRTPRTDVPEMSSPAVETPLLLEAGSTPVLRCLEGPSEISFRPVSNSKSAQLSSVHNAPSCQAKWLLCFSLTEMETCSNGSCLPCCHG